MGVDFAYFDESERVDKRLFGVGGCLFSRTARTKFAHKWKRLFGAFGGCHMRELVHCTGRFEEIDGKKRDELVRGAVEALVEHLSFATVVSCSKDDIASYGNGIEKRVEQLAYLQCCKLAAVGMVLSRDGDAPLRTVRYIFEKGHAAQGALSSLMDAVGESKVARREWRYDSHALHGKDDDIWLQAADFIAYEGLKQHAERRNRKSLFGLWRLLGNERFNVVRISRDDLHIALRYLQRDESTYWLRLA